MLIAAAVACASNAAADDPPSPMIEHGVAADPKGHALGNLEGMIGFSFRLDICGHAELGEASRRAIVDKFQSCPFAPEATQAIRLEADKVSRKLKAEIASFVAEHGKLPVEGLGDFKCPLPETLLAQLRADLARYESHHAGVEAVIDATCDALDRQLAWP